MNRRDAVAPRDAEPGDPEGGAVAEAFKKPLAVLPGETEGADVGDAEA